MNFLKSEGKNIAIILAVVLGIVLVRSWFFGESTPNSAGTLLTSVDISTNNVTVGSFDTLAILAELRNINLDGSIFNSPSFQGLKDFTVDVPTEQLGRVNPFAPLGASFGVKPSGPSPTFSSASTPTPPSLPASSGIHKKK